MRRLYAWISFLFFLGIGLLVFRSELAQASTFAQETLLTPTATTIYSGSMVTVNSDDQDEINVRAGPGSDYEIIGKLLAGQQVPGLGRSVGGDWVQISFPSGPGGIGWVYAYLITLNGVLPVVEPPPTPTPLVTPTIDPTLAAQFIVEIPPTRLPTFTPPPPLVIPTFPAVQPQEAPNKGQMVYVIAGLAVVGVLGALLSFLRFR